METYEEIVMQAVSELMVKAMSEQRISDEKVSALTDELVEISGKVMAAPMDAETRAMLDRYLSITHTLEGLREEHLYVQGAKDCVRLLKELGVLA